jgi:glycerophosphoryl diester phosphodiesterase
MPSPFDLEGHRGARGLRPENTLSSFELALDLGVTSVETDVRLTADGVAVLYHDPRLSARVCRPLGSDSAGLLAARPPVRSLTLAELRRYAADQNPRPRRFPRQEAVVSPLARLFAGERGMDAYAVPTLADLFSFVDAYAGEPGRRAGKPDRQRVRARGLWLDLELKRVPFRLEHAGDVDAGGEPGDLVGEVVEAVRAARLVRRVSVRSFDHRALLEVRSLEPRLATAALVAGNAPVSPAQLARQAEAQAYAPDFEFLDQRQVRDLHDAGIRVVPWTANRRRDWDRLLDWGVDGITTDFPDRLAAVLQERGLTY